MNETEELLIKTSADTTTFIFSFGSKDTGNGEEPNPKRPKRGGSFKSGQGKLDNPKSYIKFNGKLRRVYYIKGVKMLKMNKIYVKLSKILKTKNKKLLH
jgi:hypothetical protein